MRRGLAFCAVVTTAVLFSSAAFADPTYGIAMHGDLKYPKNFTHFGYTNPDAPKGGTLRLPSIGGFDSLNPFILKGNAAPGLNALGNGLLYQSLMTQSEDEPFSMYGLIAQTIDVAKDRRSVTFVLNPAARWHDGEKITADDVVWTFDKLMSVGSPFFKAYFGDVEKAVATAPDTVTLTIKNPDNRELPLVLSQMVVLPKHYWTAQGRDIAAGTLEPPLGSGPYRIADVKSGSQIAYERVDDWWAAGLPVSKGQYNFDRIVYDTYRDHNVALEAFFAGNYDIRSENVAKLWATGYNAPAVKDGRIRKAEIPHSQPVGMQAFIFNLRRPVFSDARVREAIGLAFDFEWANKQLADGSYTRTDSYFENSELAASGLPQGRELQILQEFKDKLPPRLFTEAFKVPATDGSGNNRANLRRAAQLLDEAGYTLGKDGVRINGTGQRLSFEFVDANPALERWILPFIQNLKKIGVLVTLRTIDPAQYQNRMNTFDYDMTTMVIPQSDSPGNEQIDFWSSVKADVHGSRNYMGIKDPVVDELVRQIIVADSRDELVALCHALDRVLLWQYNLVPNWHYPKWRVAWWSNFEFPQNVKTKSLGITETWWVVPKGAK